MKKIRANIYFKDSVRRKLRDIQYIYTKTRGLNKNIAYSEIINRLIEKLSIKKIVNLLNENKIGER